MNESRKNDKAPVQASTQSTDTGAPLWNAMNDEEAWRNVTNAGFSKDGLVQYEDAQKKSSLLSALTGGTFLGATFVGASPIIQMKRAASGRGANPTWQSFRGGVPKTAALGFAVGALANGALTEFRNINLDNEKRAMTRYVDQLEAERTAKPPAPQEQGR